VWRDRAHIDHFVEVGSGEEIAQLRPPIDPATPAPRISARVLGQRLLEMEIAGRSVDWTETRLDLTDIRVHAAEIVKEWRSQQSWDRLRTPMQGLAPERSRPSELQTGVLIEFDIDGSKFPIRRHALHEEGRLHVRAFLGPEFNPEQGRASLIDAVITVTGSQLPAFEGDLYGVELPDTVLAYTSIARPELRSGGTRVDALEEGVRFSFADGRPWLVTLNEPQDNGTNLLLVRSPVDGRLQRFTPPLDYMVRATANLALPIEPDHVIPAVGSP
jgi:hypothetical protein